MALHAGATAKYIDNTPPPRSSMRKFAETKIKYDNKSPKIFRR